MVRFALSLSCSYVGLAEREKSHRTPQDTQVAIKSRDSTIDHLTKPIGDPPCIVEVILLLSFVCGNAWAVVCQGHVISESNQATVSGGHCEAPVVKRPTSLTKRLRVICVKRSELIPSAAFGKLMSVDG